MAIHHAETAAWRRSRARTGLREPCLGPGSSGALAQVKCAAEIPLTEKRQRRPSLLDCPRNVDDGRSREGVSGTAPVHGRRARIHLARDGPPQPDNIRSNRRKGDVPVLGSLSAGGRFNLLNAYRDILLVIHDGHRRRRPEPGMGEHVRDGEPLGGVEGEHAVDQTRTKRQSDVVAPSKGKKPASMPKRQMPHDHISVTSPSYPHPTSTSGAAYDSEPHTCACADAEGNEGGEEEGGRGGHRDVRRVQSRNKVKRAAWQGEPHLMQGGSDHLPLAVPIIHVGEPEIADFAAVIVVEQHIFLRGYRAACVCVH
eukprot:scaffold2482_cov131-Isochrysis_galbana.AAC.5